MSEFVRIPRQSYPALGTITRAMSMIPGKPTIFHTGEFLHRDHISTVLLINGERVGLPNWEWRFHYKVA